MNKYVTHTNATFISGEIAQDAFINEAGKKNVKGRELIPMYLLLTVQQTNGPSAPPTQYKVMAVKNISPKQVEYMGGVMKTGRSVTIVGKLIGCKGTKEYGYLPVIEAKQLDQLYTGGGKSNNNSQNTVDDDVPF